ncbi:4-hydroxythreonine-4-phosphate dehydrogenase PdxA [Gammaproteobacteria bacterium]|nr:4-hydroxythreonine-4-phosphate dehydrogenase PdxA [Gammaproteobacteria bacterium]MDA9146522.1 4-hydroxythreonine-4-phosphate dehydrogenase PdxA [Gammaproteobacteria bacterium]MDA9174193.1 4-hydroxythreonine-4-phosphate dehydrogenase PdxA [Gammaproteobacteria bacterium]MDA9815015.1 4-hydroxythreonine-4-phosphate dehydrogenase PdxA [Gammaproteobacteria bacterium]MDB4848565.1 4-hydroxythreonine-4-phosphate dehydrogenase PdxA [Gammaproteobacteria bacterium]
MKKIVYSPGEPSGIGPDIIIQLCRTAFWTDIKIPILCISDPKLLDKRAADLGKKITLQKISDIDELKTNKRNVIQVMHISDCKNTKYGKLYKSNAQYVLDNLNFGIDEALKNKNLALVTGPISKENIISINKKFSGHTEFIQQKTNSKEVLMLLASDQLKVALTTTHIPLKNVSKKITKELIISKAITLNKGLKEKFKIKNPIIKMLGLNPHSGEGGKIGKEEVDIIIPAVKELRKKKINISYPVSADTAFTKKNLKETDAFLGMYHDQVLPVIKALSFGNAINVTLGVPITRTSVDHGVALDIAGSGKADPSSLKEAIKAAKKII